MGEFRIEGVTDELYHQLTKHAGILGISLNDYLVPICESAAEPAVTDEALDCLGDLPPYPTAKIISPWTDH